MQTRTLYDKNALIQKDLQSTSGFKFATDSKIYGNQNRCMGKVSPFAMKPTYSIGTSVNIENNLFGINKRLVKYDTINYLLPKCKSCQGENKDCDSLHCKANLDQVCKDANSLFNIGPIYSQLEATSTIKSIYEKDRTYQWLVTPVNQSPSDNTKIGINTRLLNRN